MDRLELFLQVELALVLEQRAAHVVLDLSLEAKNLDLGGRSCASCESRAGSVGASSSVCRTSCRTARCAATAHACRSSDAVACTSVTTSAGIRRWSETYSSNSDSTRRPSADWSPGSPSSTNGSGAIVARKRAAARRVARDAGAGDALDEDLRGAVRQPHDLHEPRDHADPEEVAGGRILLVGVPLGHEQDDVAIVGRGVDGGERLRAPDEQRHDDVRKHHDVAERQHGQAARALGSARCRG